MHTWVCGPSGAVVLISVLGDQKRGCFHDWRQTGEKERVIKERQRERERSVIHELYLTDPQLYENSVSVLLIGCII